MIKLKQHATKGHVTHGFDVLGTALICSVFSQQVIHIHRKYKVTTGSTPLRIASSAGFLNNAHFRSVLCTSRPVLMSP